jgi:hypothetical protein
MEDMGMMAFLKQQPPLEDEQRISRVTRSIESDKVLSSYVPKRIPVPPPTVPAGPAADYAEVLEKVRALSIKAVDTYGNRVVDEVREIVRGHLEVVLALANRQEQIERHYFAEMEAVRKDTNDFTTNARRDLERLAALAPMDTTVTTEAIAHIVDEELNGETELVPQDRQQER